MKQAVAKILVAAFTILGLVSVAAFSEASATNYYSGNK